MIAIAGFMFLGIFLMFDFIDVDSRTNPQPTNLHVPAGGDGSRDCGRSGCRGRSACCCDAGRWEKRVTPDRSARDKRGNHPRCC